MAFCLPVDADTPPAQNRVMAKKKKITREELDEQIRAIQALCRQKPGEKSVVQELLEEHRAEKEKEDR